MFAALKIEFKFDKVLNVYGSSAGAGSGDFHAYRHARDKERRRINRNKAILRQKTEHEAFASKVEEAKAECDARTRRNQAKRRRKKERIARAKRLRRSDAEFGKPKAAAASDSSSKAAAASDSTYKSAPASESSKGKEGKAVTEVQAKIKVADEPATNKQVFMNDGSFMENFSKIA